MDQSFCSKASQFRGGNWKMEMITLCPGGLRANSGVPNGTTCKAHMHASLSQYRRGESQQWPRGKLPEKCPWQCRSALACLGTSRARTRPGLLPGLASNQCLTALTPKTLADSESTPRAWHFAKQSETKAANPCADCRKKDANATSP